MDQGRMETRTQINPDSTYCSILTYVKKGISNLDSCALYPSVLFHTSSNGSCSNNFQISKWIFRVMNPEASQIPLGSLTLLVAAG